MLSRRIVGASSRLVAASRLPVLQRRTFMPDAIVGRKTLEEYYPDSEYPTLTDKEDPEMNGGYVNPPRIKRQFRDPHADWWDKQERRNYGEPVHEDHDILGMFSPYEYTWTTTGKGLAQIGAFITVFFGVLYAVKISYPDKRSYPREFEGGLEKELGGAGAILIVCFPVVLHSSALHPAMRFEDWDVILFPVGRDAKIPFKEFKVACHAIPDPELCHSHGSAGMPVMTCFVPSLPAGTPFQISIHCWRKPEISQFALTYSKHPDLIRFEARILLDGRLMSSTTFDRNVNGPHLITSTFEFTKTGELERLRFPHFRRELLYQNYWSPSDDLGRIKVILSEGFPRDSMSVPIERVKNIVAFSFQHAPLELLESNGIAWPSPAMWRRTPYNPPGPVPTYQPEDGVHSHAHSPRKRPSFRENKAQGFPSFGASGVLQPQATASFFAGQPVPMPFLPRGSTGGSSLSFPGPSSETAYFDWTNAFSSGQSSLELGGRTVWPARNTSKQSSDTSMPDYISNRSGDAMHISGPSLEDHPMTLKVPTNTPATGTNEEAQCPQFTFSSYGMASDLVSSLPHSLLSQPTPLPIPTYALPPHAIPLPSSEIKSRKENRHLNVGGSNPSSTRSTPHGLPTEIRKFSQPAFGLGGMMPMPTSTEGLGSLSVSPNTETVFSGGAPGSPSAGKFGLDLAGDSAGLPATCSPIPAPQHPLSEPTADDSTSGALSIDTCNTIGGNFGSRRGRHFTPVSAKVIDEEDEPRKSSLHRRASGYGEQSSIE
ncbi:hypothetical protein B0T14DRAFT_540224 [Immersiella caudata]|uniref:Uncharacterized protein n=1 Tax=Immersiella caudata TaxID=314043 RepID=A0AA39TH98_9PEZI|nr:hypothetical protein B0T14DRAFT_540224 [Immersiella caudata]